MLVMAFITGCGAEKEAEPIYMGNKTEFEVHIYNANRGDIDAMVKAADSYMYGVDVDIDYVRAYAWYKAAIDKDNNNIKHSKSKESGLAGYEAGRCEEARKNAATVLVTGKNIYGRQIDSTGYFVNECNILTSCDSIKDWCYDYEVTLYNGKVYDACLIKADMEENLALLKIAGYESELYYKVIEENEQISELADCKVADFINKDVKMPEYYKAYEGFETYQDILWAVSVITDVDYDDFNIIEDGEYFISFEYNKVIDEEEREKFFEQMNHFVLNNYPSVNGIVDDSDKEDKESFVRYFNDESYFDLIVEINDEGKVVVSYKANREINYEYSHFLDNVTTTADADIYKNYDIETLIMMENKLDYEATTELGRRYLLGEGLKKNIDVAFTKLYSLSAKPIGKAHYYIAEAMREKYNSDGSYRKAVNSCLIRAYDYGYVDASIKLGEYNSAHGDDVGAFAYFYEGANNGNVQASWYCGKYLLKGYGTAKDEILGLKYLNKAAESGCVGAMTDLAVYYEEGMEYYRSREDEYSKNYYRSKFMEWCMAIIAADENNLTYVDKLARLYIEEYNNPIMGEILYKKYNIEYEADEKFLDSTEEVLDKLNEEEQTKQ